MTMSPPTEVLMRKLRRAGDPVRAMEGGGRRLVAYTMNRIRLIKDMLASNLNKSLKQHANIVLQSLNQSSLVLGFCFIPTLRAGEEYGQVGSPTRKLTDFGFGRATHGNQESRILPERKKHFYDCVQQTLIWMFSF